jgi:hypothetical protein
MDDKKGHRQHMEDLHKEALGRYDEYMKTKSQLGKEHHEKAEEAKTKWQKAWNELMEALIVLERIEI